MNIIKRLLCKHDYVTISNFYGDYINYISLSKIYRSRQQCMYCGKTKLSEYLDAKCSVINDGTYIIH